MSENNDINLHIEESMVKNIQEYNNIKEEITCEICYGIVVKPKICETCETLFCENCINNWKKKNNTCPKRCSNFIIKDAPKVIKKLLDKLKILCTFCKNDFNYDTYLYKHFPECYKKNRLVKCPFCPNCKIKFCLIEEYQKILKENEQLKNKIKMYEENNQKIQNINKITYRWKKDQIKNDFTLSKDNKTIKINYSSCYNTYVLDYDFIDELEYCLDISINTFGIEFDFIYLGFMNEKAKNSENSNCLCRKPDNNFYIRIDNETIYEGRTEYKIKLENIKKLNIRFILNLKTKKLEIKNYDNNNTYRVINVYGKIFKFFVQKCNKGTIEYTLLS